MSAGLQVGTLVVDWAMTKRTELVPDADTCREGLTRQELTTVARGVFKQRAGEVASAEQRVEHEDDAFEALRILAAQQQQQLCSSTCVTRGMHVRASTIFFGAQRASPMYVFVYRIRIENHGEETIQLKARCWEFLDANGKIAGHIPKGSSGVVGKTPVLKPGQVFEYSSGVELPTSEGRMSGSFQMAKIPADIADGDAEQDAEADEEFDVFVAPTGASPALPDPPSSPSASLASTEALCGAPRHRVSRQRCERRQASTWRPRSGRAVKCND